MQLQISYIHSNILYIECMKKQILFVSYFHNLHFYENNILFPFCEKKHKNEIFMSLKRDII